MSSSPTLQPLTVEQMIAALAERGFTVIFGASPNVVEPTYPTFEINAMAVVLANRKIIVFKPSFNTFDEVRRATGVHAWLHIVDDKDSFTMTRTETIKDVRWTSENQVMIVELV